MNQSIDREKKKGIEESGTVVGLSLVGNEQIEFVPSLYYSASEMSLIYSLIDSLFILAGFVCLIEFMIEICLAVITSYIFAHDFI